MNTINSKLLRDKQRNISSTNSNLQSPETITEKSNGPLSPTKQTLQANHDKLNTNQKSTTNLGTQYSNNVCAAVNQDQKTDESCLNDIQIDFSGDESALQSHESKPQAKHQKPIAPIITSSQVAYSALKKSGCFLTRALSTPSIANKGNAETKSEIVVNDAGMNFA